MRGTVAGGVGPYGFVGSSPTRSVFEEWRARHMRAPAGRLGRVRRVRKESLSGTAACQGTCPARMGLMPFPSHSALACLLARKDLDLFVQPSALPPMTADPAVKIRMDARATMKWTRRP
jgi:hypothetical protein